LAPNLAGAAPLLRAGITTYSPMRNYVYKVDAQLLPGSAGAAEEILIGAMRSSRPGYRPHR